MTDLLKFKAGVQRQTLVVCAKHGTHAHTIVSTIPGHEGHWCQICWLESLGEPLPTTLETLPDD